ncbi:MAG: hypothetical protein M4579_001418 [Chaenotheca gracillima]|nr:MAG: hypothetical protein M4579_001418 [Chaenotheca gracillima]
MPGMQYSARLSAETASLRTLQLDGDESETSASAPIHPIACMQGAFEESMIETTKDPEAQSSKVLSEKVDSATRRGILLEQGKHEETHAGRWRPRPGERYHPLWKLIAQVAFGVHLLHRQLAKSDEDVISILQMHVEEVDEFLEKTVEDFDLALRDTEERVQCLKLPLENVEVFDTMLNNREFRKSIIEGNERIEHITSRTTTAMIDALRDVKHGLEATKELAKYLTQLDIDWNGRTEDQQGVFMAMCGNAEGWSRCFVSLQKQGNGLQSLLYQLSTLVGQTQKRVGVASRRNIGTLHPSTSSSSFVSNMHHSSRDVSRSISPNPASSPRKALSNDSGIASISQMPLSKAPIVRDVRSHERLPSRENHTPSGRVKETRFRSDTPQSSSIRSSPKISERKRPPSRRTPDIDRKQLSPGSRNDSGPQKASSVPSRSESRMSLLTSRSFSPNVSRGQPAGPQRSLMFRKLSSVWRDRSPRFASPANGRRPTTSPSGATIPSLSSPRTNTKKSPDVAQRELRLSPLIGTSTDLDRSSSSQGQKRPPLTTIPSDSAYASAESESLAASPLLSSKGEVESAGTEHVVPSATQPIPPQAQRLLGVTTPTPEKRRRRTKLRQALARSLNRFWIKVASFPEKRRRPSRPAEVVTFINSADPPTKDPWI